MEELRCRYDSVRGDRAIIEEMAYMRRFRLGNMVSGAGCLRGAFALPSNVEGDIGRRNFGDVEEGG